MSHREMAAAVLSRATINELPVSPWWDSRENLAVLCGYLVSHEQHDADDLLHVLEKPWKWSSEFAAAQVDAWGSVKVQVER